MIRKAVCLMGTILVVHHTRYPSYGSTVTAPRCSAALRISGLHWQLATRLHREKIMTEKGEKTIGPTEPAPFKFQKGRLRVGCKVCYSPCYSNWIKLLVLEHTGYNVCYNARIKLLPLSGAHFRPGDSSIA